MSFSSISFVCFFLPAAVLLYQAAAASKIRKGTLIFISLLFYAAGAVKFLPLLLFMCFLNYILAILIGRGRDCPETTSRKAALWLIIGIILNFGLLACYKYVGMLKETVSLLTGTPAGSESTAAAAVLPLGISFFTFQLTSYLADVYRGKTPADRNFANVLLYTSFFPKMTAGPIVSYQNFFDGVYSGRIPPEQLSAGARRFIFGLSKKVLISDVLGVTVDYVYGLSQAELSLPAAWLGALSYMLQIYFDFSGYSDMAIGLGQLFGFSLPENFRTPYASGSMREFWRRWHMTLNLWFRDYVYIPLGGNRRGKGRTMLNQLIVFFFTGLWHGASWNFVLWGLFHGLFCMLESCFPAFLTKLKAFRHLYVWLVTLIGFVLFRAGTLYDAGRILGSMLGLGGLMPNLLQKACLNAMLSRQFIMILAAGILLSFPWRIPVYRRTAQGGPLSELKKQKIAEGISILLLILCLTAMSAGSYKAFIYTQF